MTETRKIAAILAADVVGFSRMASADEDRTLARLRALRADLIDPTIAGQNGHVFKRTGDGALVEFRSVVEAVRCAITIQNAMIERNVGMPADQRIVFRIGIHLGDVVEESDGDLMGDGVNIAARLEGIAEPGAICLSEDAYRQVKGRLDLAVTDLGPTRLKNIAEPVRAYSLQVGVPAVPKPATQAKRSEARKRSMLAPLAAGIVAFIVIAGGAWYFLAGNRSAPAAHLSIVVLPFTNLSNDPAQDYFADGVTENLTTELSRIRDSFVIARNTAFTFKGKNLDAKEIGKDLGVRYVLEGSVQRDGTRVRVNAQLIDAQSGAHLWAERFEENLTDLFKLQDQVVARLANTLGFELVKAEAQRSAHSTNPDAIDLTMRGWASIWKPATKESSSAAKDFFERALQLDPENAEAMVGAALARFRANTYGWSTAAEDGLAAQLDAVAKASAINPGYAFGYLVKAVVAMQMRQVPEGFEAAQMAIALDPNLAGGYAVLGFAERGLGRCESSIEHVKQAFALSPHDPTIGVWHMWLGYSELCRGRLDAAIEEFKRSIDAGYRIVYTYGLLAAALALKGDDAEARVALTEARRLAPELTVKWFMTRGPELPIAAEGLRKAGLPEE